MDGTAHEKPVKGHTGRVYIKANLQPLYLAATNISNDFAFAAAKAKNDATECTRDSPRRTFLLPKRSERDPEKKQNKQTCMKLGKGNDGNKTERG